MSLFDNTFSSLLEKIAKNGEIITTHLKKANKPEPSFAADSASISGPDDDPELQAARAAIIEATTYLKQLALGPQDYFFDMAGCLKYDMSMLDVLNINHFPFTAAVPLDGSASYAEIASKVGLSEKLVRRILRYAMTMQIFAESPAEPGRVVHTAASAALTQTPYISAFAAHNVCDVAPGSIKFAETLKKYPDSEQPGESACYLALVGHADKGRKNIFDFLANDGEGEQKGYRMRRFGEALDGFKKAPAFKFAHIHDAFEWEQLGDATVVDVGGNIGYMSFELASTYPRLKCIVQDIPEYEAQFTAAVPSAISSRVQFNVHDFFEPQPVQADVYFFRFIFHDWSDPYSVEIIRALLPSMRDGSRIIVMDTCAPKAGQLPWAGERMTAMMDMQMLVAFNSKERNEDDWYELFQKADERLEVKGIKTPPGSALSVIEVVFHEKK